MGFLASARSAAGELDDSIQVAGLELMILYVHSADYSLRTLILSSPSEKVLHINKDALAYVFAVAPQAPDDSLTSRRNRSLQIFSNENHASIHSDKTKEGLSLFGSSSSVVLVFSTHPPGLTGILNLARTPLGRALLRKWFFRPPLEIDVIESRHAAVECFLRNENRARWPCSASGIRLT